MVTKQEIKKLKEALSKIKKEMKDRWIRVIVPKNTKTANGGELKEGDNWLLLGGEKTMVHFSKDAILAIENGDTVAMGYVGRDKLGVVALVYDKAKAAVVGSQAGGFKSCVQRLLEYTLRR